MDRWQNRVAVVTGAAYGIGADITKDFLHAGIIVAGLDIAYDGLQKLRDSFPPAIRPRLHIFKCDVTQPAEADAAFDAVEQQLGGVDILINNAGIHREGRLCQVELAIAQQVVQTNLMQVVHCTQRAYESMKRRKIDGHIIFLNSISGHNTAPTSLGVGNMYIPSKQALTAMNDVLRQEFRDEGLRIKVTNLCPGLVDTEMVPPHIRARNADVMLRVEDVTKAVMFIIGMPPHVQVHDVIMKCVGERV